MVILQEEAMSSEDRLFAVPAQSGRSGTASCPPELPVYARPQAAAAPLFSVVGGRMVQQPSGGGFPLNGQQLQLQLDQLTSAMTDMAVEDETMEVGHDERRQKWLI